MHEYAVPVWIALEAKSAEDAVARVLAAFELEGGPADSICEAVGSVVTVCVGNLDEVTK